MQTIDLLPGTTIAAAARMLVANAPARADFNGIRIRARYATTRPEDVERHYQIRCDLRGHAWRHSPEGIPQAARDRADVEAKQGAINSLMRGLALLDFGNCAAVLTWIEAMVEPSDRVGVAVLMDEIRAAFAAHGWEANANCGEHFDGEDERNFAGWIVGQWLAIRYPGVVPFIGQWRAKFRSAGDA